MPISQTDVEWAPLFLQRTVAVINYTLIVVVYTWLRKQNGSMDTWADGFELNA